MKALKRGKNIPSDWKRKKPCQNADSKMGIVHGFFPVDKKKT